MSRLRPTIPVSLILLTILSLVIDVVLIVVLILNVYGSGDNGRDNNVPSSIRPTGCVVGTFTAGYQRQGVDFTINRVFLCGDNLHYRFTNEAGLRVYNEKQVD